MKAVLYWIVIVVIAGAVIGAHLAFRGELTSEAEREKPIQPPAQVTKDSGGAIEVVLNKESRSLAGIESIPVVVHASEFQIPSAALVRYDGQDWLYEEVAPERYVKRRVSLREPVIDGWLVSGEIEAQGKIVTVGAEVLLSEELKSQIQISGD